MRRTLKLTAVALAVAAATARAADDGPRRVKPPASQPTAKSVVYLCSDAASMAGKLAAVQGQLVSSAKAAQADGVRFDVVFCHGATKQSCFRGKLKPATADTVAVATTFVRAAKATGKSNPLAGIAAAIAERPDRIFFLFDGLDTAVRPKQLVDAFAKANPDLDHPTVTVDVIYVAATGQPPTDLMDAIRLIGEQSRGQVKLVPIPDAK